MNNERHYFEVKEIIDDPEDVNRYIDGGAWDLLEVGKRKRELAENVYEDRFVYVIGHRADAR
jgi:hypothetical protein